jgi:hypothetical protein
MIIEEQNTSIVTYTLMCINQGVSHHCDTLRCLQLVFYRRRNDRAYRDPVLTGLELPGGLFTSSI